jgi:hypothetical protein
MMNFDLEEQLVRSDVTSGEAETRQRALTVVEFSLSEKEKVPLSLPPSSLSHSLTPPPPPPKSYLYIKGLKRVAF